MTEEWFVQHNFKVGEDLVNLRGRDVAHLMQNAREYAENIGELSQIKANLLGGNSLAQIVKPQQAQRQEPVDPGASNPQNRGGGGWGQAPGNNVPPPQQFQQQGQQGGARLHPEGKTCPCGNVLNYKEVNRRSDGKLFKFWECPQRKGSKDTQHVSEFAN